MSRNSQQISFTITVTDDQVRNFQEMFSGLINSFLWKVKNDSAVVHQRLDENSERVESHLAEYRDYCVDTFNHFVSGGESPRSALSLTVSAVHGNYPASSFDQVKKILTESKLLKNTGFYKKR